MFTSGRSGRWQVWVAGIDGSGLVQVSDPVLDSGSPQWSPDGQKVAFDVRQSAHWEIYIADIAERLLRKLATNLSSGIRPHWSRDGKWVYFQSYDVGKAGIYRCPSTGGDASRLSPDPDAYTPIESPDGKAVYFVTPSSKSRLKQITKMAGAAESTVEEVPPIRGPEMWTPVTHGIYFVPADAPDSLDYFDLASRKIKHITKIDREFYAGLSVSPGGTHHLY